MVRLLARLPSLRPLRLLLAFGASMVLASQPLVQERRLGNGLRVLAVAQRGSGAVHARLVVRAGRADTGALPAAAADLLARCLFGRPLPEDLAQAPPLDEALRQEEGAFEALRLARLSPGQESPGAPDPASLHSLHAPLHEALAARVEGVQTWDALDALGIARRRVQVEADAIALALDLPTASLEPWFRLEAQRLGRLQLARFPVERDALLRESAAAGASPAALLLATALGGHPYSQVLEPAGLELEAAGWSEIRDWARTRVVPERTVLILVGEVSLDALAEALEVSFGAWPAPERPLPPDHSSFLAPGGQAPRRLLLAEEGAPELLMAWRTPPATHPEAPVVEVLALLLGRHPRSRAALQLLDPAGPAEALEVRSAFPGGRQPGLFLIQARPRDGRALGEIEQSILAESQRLQQHGPEEREIRMARACLELEQAETQEDPAILATRLGEAVCQGRDWTHLFSLPSGAGTALQGRVQRVARTLLTPANSTVVLQEPDPIQRPRDAQEQRLVRTLTRLLAPSLEGAEAEGIVREALRQVRLLPRAERERTLLLLEAQVKP